MFFQHEKLDVYRAAMSFVKKTDEIIKRLPRGRAYLVDQLQRAAASIPANIAEGAGEYSRKDKARFYRIALRSATECAAFLDIIMELALVEEAEPSDAKKLIARIVAMLTAMVLKLGDAQESRSDAVEPDTRCEKRPDGNGSGDRER
jgi:four helix bundle protein